MPFPRPCAHRDVRTRAAGMLFRRVEGMACDVLRGGVVSAINYARLRSRPHAHVLRELPRPRLPRVDVSGAVRGSELGAGPSLVARVAPRVEDELVDPSGRGLADADTHLPARVLDIVGLGVRDVDPVLLVERDAARLAELRPGRNEVAVL